jgi:hypothetical protein
MSKKVSMKKLGFDVVAAVDSIATEVRRDREYIEYELDFDKQRADVKRRIIDAAEVRGEQFTTQDVETATDLFFQKQFRFVEPQRGLVKKFAEAYTDRVRIGKRYGIPVAVILTVSALVSGTMNAVNQMRLAAQERGIETRIETAYQERARVVAQVENNLQILATKDMPVSEKARAVNLIIDAKRRISETDVFFNKFCSDGTSVDDVTPENYFEAGTLLASVDSNLNEVRTDFLSVNEIFSLQDNLSATKGSLEALMQEVKSNNPPKVFLDRANAAYESGLADLVSRNLSEAKTHGEELVKVIGDVKQFAVLPLEAEKAYAMIKTIAKESEAIQMGDKLHQEAQVYVEKADVSRLSQTVQGMKQLGEVLNQEYSLRVVSKPGVKSGIDRYYSGSFSGWYVVVEAIDKSGAIISRDITSCEDGKTQRVAMWAEKTTETNPKVVEAIKSGNYDGSSLIQRIIKDKLTDGVVDDNLMGKKERGYLHHKLNVEGFVGKQITSW